MVAHFSEDHKKDGEKNFDKIIESLLEVPPDHIKKPTPKKPKPSKPHTKKKKK